MWCAKNCEPDGGRPEPDDKSDQTYSQHRPVEGDPDVGVHRTDRSQGGQRGQADHHRPSEDGAEDDGNEHTQETFADCDGRTCSQGAKNPAVLLAEA